MKKNMRNQIVVCLAALAVLVGWAGFGQAAVEPASLIVTEAWGNYDIIGGYEYYDLDFTVTNNGYTDIREFAIGNNYADWVGVATSLSHSSDYLTNGVLAEKIDGQWKAIIYLESGTISRDLTWLDGAAGFDDYTMAFLFTSWEYSSSGYSGYLEQGFTNGYWGSTQMPASPFAAYSEGSGTTITGETSAVPIPGAIWLLGSGLITLVGIRRRG